MTVAMATELRRLSATELAEAPTGIGGGLPQAVQVIGPRHGEDLCLGFPGAIEDRLGIITPIDPG
jgi:amidase